MLSFEKKVCFHVFEALLIAAAFTALVATIIHKKGQQRPSRKQRRIHRITQEHTPARLLEPSPESHARPFEADSAEAPSSSRVIKGPAYVIDGDSLVINKTQVRLHGIDAPEINHPYGKKAKWAMVTLCKGQTISAEILAEDDHGRTVARCRLADGRDLSAELVKLGLAIDWPKFSGGEYRALEVDDARRKMWLADARQKGRMYVWKRFEARQAAQKGES